MDKIAVLNGVATVGDEVAYSVRVGNNAETVMGTLMEISEAEDDSFWGTPRIVPRLKVRVTRRSSFGKVKTVLERPSTMEHPERVVKLLCCSCTFSKTCFIFPPLSC